VSGYLVLEGPDGCGKSSQAQALCEWLRQQGRKVLHVREPGSTPVGEALRRLLLARATGELRPVTEALLFMAARAELVTQVIAPALDGGAVVVAERCYLSTVVYQGLAAQPGLDVDWLFDLTRRVHGARLPDAIFVLDVSEQVAVARRSSRADDRFEARPAAFHARVRQGFAAAAAREPRAHLVDAGAAFDRVQAELRALSARVLG